ncbi:hypothetical protein [Salinispora arenicola]|uniref:hypothetical protein n=1 Tax=Salinispora arenicola TaxID=168697 RepID=UPI00039AF17D|nr:hypothetical protein [Salinispora arenicola]
MALTGETYGWAYLDVSIPAALRREFDLAWRACHPAGLEEWAFNGMTYLVNSMYLLSEDAWTYELTGSSHTSSAVAMLALVIPDATPDGEQFTPVDATHAYVTAAQGTLPWPMLRRFIRFVETPGDIVTGEPTATVTGDLVPSLNSWNLVHRVFEVTSYHDGEHDGWCYEVDPANASNDYIDVRIPDLPPADGPFVPAPHDMSQSLDTAARAFPGRSSGAFSTPCQRRHHRRPGVTDTAPVGGARGMRR